MPFRRQYRTLQPGDDARVNFSKPLARGLQLLLLPTQTGIRDLINPEQQWAPTGSVSVSARSSSVGPVRANIFPTGSDNYYSSTGYSWLTGDEGTFFMWLPLFNSLDINGSRWLHDGTTLFGWDESVSNKIRVFGFGSPAISSYTTLTGKQNQALVLGQNSGGANRKYWRNGVLEGGTAGGSQSWAAGSKTLIFGGSGFYNFFGQSAIVGFTNKLWTTSDAVAFYQNPWQLFAPLPTRRYFFPTVVYQYARPASDISAGGWQPSSGGDLYAMLDEASADDGDYIYSPDNPTTEQFEVKLGTITDPATSDGHTIKLRLQAIDQDTQFDLDLVEGSTVLDSWTEAVTVAAGVVQRERTLSGAVTDSITDYSDLRVRGVAKA